jgi:hypothetical protein
LTAIALFSLYLFRIALYNSYKQYHLLCGLRALCLLASLR